MALERRARGRRLREHRDDPAAVVPRVVLGARRRREPGAVLAEALEGQARDEADALGARRRRVRRERAKDGRRVLPDQPDADAEEDEAGAQRESDGEGGGLDADRSLDALLAWRLRLRGEVEGGGDALGLRRTLPRPAVRAVARGCEGAFHRESGEEVGEEGDERERDGGGGGGGGGELARGRAAGEDGEEEGGRLEEGTAETEGRTDELGTQGEEEGVTEEGACAEHNEERLCQRVGRALVGSRLAECDRADVEIELAPQPLALVSGVEEGEPERHR